MLLSINHLGLYVFDLWLFPPSHNIVTILCPGPNGEIGTDQYIVFSLSLSLIVVVVVI